MSIKAYISFVASALLRTLLWGAPSDTTHAGRELAASDSAFPVAMGCLFVEF